MTADPANLRFFVDESILGLGKALTIARDDVIHTGHPLIMPDVPLGALDPTWIPEVAQRGLAVILRDRHIRIKAGERQLLQKESLRVFWIAGTQDLTTWGYLVRLVRRWDDIEDRMANRGPGPWFMAINENSISELPV